MEIKTILSILSTWLPFSLIICSMAKRGYDHYDNLTVQVWKMECPYHELDALQQLHLLRWSVRKASLFALLGIIVLISSPILWMSLLLIWFTQGVLAAIMGLSSRGLCLHKRQSY